MDKYPSEKQIQKFLKFQQTESNKQKKDNVSKLRGNNLRNVRVVQQSKTINVICHANKIKKKKHKYLKRCRKSNGQNLI